MNPPDNTKGLDEILFEAIEAASSYTHTVTAEEADTIQEELKQAILHWIDREVIGNNKNLFFSNEVPTFNSLEEWMGRVVKIRDVLRAEQRTILTQHGYKGGK